MIGVVRTVADLRAAIAAYRGAGDTVALVPTMGALHAGHLTLVRRGLDLADRCIVTLFVNPKQFGPNEDFAVYPRTEADDAAKLGVAGADLLFAPPLDQVYPDGFVTQVSVARIGDDLEGRFRPGFFTGVATVVTKLLLQASPDVACFGEKDYQQLQVIKRLVRDLDIPVAIEGVETVREDDGLALSSRNAYLSATERVAAAVLNRTLAEMARRFRAGGADPAELEIWGRDQLAAAAFGTVDYLTLRDAATLEPVSVPEGPARVLGAAQLGKARLIDNLPA